MSGPLPKTDAHGTPTAARANAPTIPTTDVSITGHDGPIPEPTVALGESARRFYDRAWRSPAANAWLEDEADVVAEWAGLKAVVAAELAAGAAPQSALLAQIKAREDALYLSPLARAKGRVRLVEPAPDENEADASAGRWADVEVAD